MNDVYVSAAATVRVDNVGAGIAADDTADEMFFPSCRTVPFLAYPSPGAGFGAARLSAG